MSVEIFVLPLRCNFDLAGKEKGAIQSPSLLELRHMIEKELVKKIVDDYLADGHVFLVGLKISRQNQIRVFLDGDTGVTIQDCSRLSRHIESLLDRDREDFELQVSSVGVEQPLLLIRQYKNNIGRRLAIRTTDDLRIKGKLTEVNDQGITIEKDKADKGKKKKKEPDTDTEAIVFVPFDQILEAKVQVSFK